MVLAAGSSVSPELLLWTLLGGALISGSAGAINCVWDADIDALMERTKNRPIPSGRVSRISALTFSLTIGVLGLLVLAVRANLLAASIALFGHFFYVFIYTMWLKRSTPQNIVIGGAAGALPPIVGWVAVTGEVDLTAMLIFSIIFLWTPPHFWALAINRNEDYQRAGIPMMPVVAGIKTSVIQMLAYSISLLPVSILLIFSAPRLSWFSVIFLLGLSLMFISKNLRLFLLLEKEPQQVSKSAWDVFGFSVLYLGLFFLCLVVDSLLV
jgi:protoheme IX farnesyltransferase